MKNYWLLKIEKEKSGRFKEALFHDLCSKYINQPQNRSSFIDDLIDLIYQLSELIIDYAKPKCLAKYDRDDVIQELVTYAWQKLQSFIPGKAKAFNYFSTVMLGRLRQL